MNILVLNPRFKKRFSRTSRSPAVTKGGTIYYPFWLAYAVGVLEQAGHDVHFIDAAADDLTIQEVISKLEGFKPQICVLDTSTPSLFADIDTANKIKTLFPNCFITLVGTHPSAEPEETLGFSKSVDAVAIKEYDYTLRDLAQALQEQTDLSKVTGLAFKKDGQIIVNPPREQIEDLDALPFVSSVYQKHLHIKKYFFAASDHPFVMIITGRGCPNRCFFCLYPQTFHSRKYRFRSPENIVAEFEYIKKNMPEVRQVGIEDDTFTVNKKRTQKVCELLIKKKVNLSWYCNVRANLDLETMKIMKQAGCKLITVGFESATQEILNKINKGTTIERIKQFVRDAKRAKLQVHGCFMAGNPGETKATLANMTKFAKKLNTDSMQFYPLIVYPGTEAYAWAKKEGYLLPQSYDQWNDEEGKYRCVLSLPGGLDAEYLVNYCNQATREYYLRPSYILMKLGRMLARPSDIKRTAMAAPTFFRSLMSK